MYHKLQRKYGVLLSRPYETHQIQLCLRKTIYSWIYSSKRRRDDAHYGVVRRRYCGNYHMRTGGCIKEPNAVELRKNGNSFLLNK